MLYLVQNLKCFSPVCVVRKGEYVRVFESQKEGSVRVVLWPTNVGQQRRGGTRRVAIWGNVGIEGVCKVYCQ